MVNWTPSEFSYEYPSEGGRIVSTTHPGGATEIRTTYPDGQTKAVLGTAVAPMKMKYGTFTDDGESEAKKGVERRK